MNQNNYINTERNNNNKIYYNNMYNNMYNNNNFQENIPFMGNSSNKDVRIQQLEQLLNEERTKNIELNKNINNLNSLLLEEKNKNNELNEKIKKLEENIKENFSSEIINELHKVIDNNKNQIDKLKEKLERYPFELLPGEKMISIIFSSLKKDVHYSVICKNTDKFVNVELKLYNDYPEYNDGEDNFFTVNGKKILKYKTLEENGIKNSDVILLNKNQIK